MRISLPSLAALMLFAGGSAHAQAPTLTQVFNDVCGPVLFGDVPDMAVAMQGARRLGFAIEYRQASADVEQLEATGHGAEVHLELSRGGGDCIYILPSGGSRVGAEREVDRLVSDWKRRTTATGYVWAPDHDPYMGGQATVETRSDGRVVFVLTSWW